MKRIYDKPGRCQWHDVVFVERVPEYPGTYFCFLCEDSNRDLLAGLNGLYSSAAAEEFKQLGPHVADPLPVHLQAHVDNWLASNQQTPDIVRYGRFPLGMVQRWIERAEHAEAKR